MCIAMQIAVHLKFAKVCPTLLDSDANICVVEIASIQFKELNQKNSKIVLECPAMFSRMILWKNKEEVNNTKKQNSSAHSN